ncbi:site-specific integrase [Serratia nevei]|jgi:integrase|uniref:site-specific integrase n=1 Tax=Serratia nevei TaxID=2703794 RepID=UPI002AA0C3F7|nr:site-specific integrase [Serratia nevei]
MKIKKVTMADKKNLKEKLESILKTAEEEGKNPGVMMHNLVSDALKNINTEVKKETAEQYRELFASKIKKDPDADLVSHLLDCGTKNSFDKTRSAFRFCIAEEIKKLLREADKLRKEKNFTEMKEKTLEAFKQYTLFEKEFLSESRLIWGDISYKKKSSLSKKKTMNSVSSIKAVFDDLKNKQELFDRYGMMLSISSITGCRPAELMKGITIEREDKLIHICISGAKIADDRGQEKRKLTFNADDFTENEQMKYILNRFSDNEKIFKYQSSKKEYDGLRQYLYLNHKGFSLYTLRHRVASQLKKSGYDENVIAGFMGHRTTKSQSSYGYSRSSLKGLTVDSVACSNDIKQNNRHFKVKTTEPGPRPVGVGGKGKFTPK